MNNARTCAHNLAANGRPRGDAAPCGVDPPRRALRASPVSRYGVLIVQRAPR
jgi:hypothetical protein